MPLNGSRALGIAHKKHSVRSGFLRAAACTLCGFLRAAGCTLTRAGTEEEAQVVELEAAPVPQALGLQVEAEECL